MTVWMTGATGMLGQCIGRLLDQNSISWVGTDLELDIADSERVNGFVAQYKPGVVINCAAYTAVDAAESNEVAAQRVNALGPSVLATACHATRAALLHFSTDYVFGGCGKEPFVEDAKLAPCNVYGASKARGEKQLVAVLGADDRTRWWILRTSWLFGDGRSSFVETMWNLMKTKEELRVVADQVGRPTYAGDLASTALRVAGLLNPKCIVQSGVWHFANVGETSWYEFACAIRQAMLDVGEEVSVQRIVPVSTAEFPRPAARPAYSVLDTGRLTRVAGIVPRTWKEALFEYIQQRSTGKLR